jgi:hypothetical protein
LGGGGGGGVSQKMPDGNTVHCKKKFSILERNEKRTRETRQ